jgi:hypothetical protein
MLYFQALAFSLYVNFIFINEIHSQYTRKPLYVGPSYGSWINKLNLSVN